MTKELLGRLLGWFIVIVSAWFIALIPMSYVLGSPYFWEWNEIQRAAHVAIQLALLLTYATFIREK